MSIHLILRNSTFMGPVAIYSLLSFFRENAPITPVGSSMILLQQ